MDVSDVQFRQVGPRRRVNLPTPTDEAGLFRGRLCQPDGLLNGMGNLDILCRPTRLPGDDDCAAVGKQPDLFVGSSPEDDGVPGGDGLETTEVGGDVPEHVLPRPDDAVVGYRGYGDYPHQVSLTSNATHPPLENPTLVAFSHNSGLVAEPS